MSHLRLAVFDMDGTLVDPQANIVAAMSAAWARLGLGEPDPEQVRRIIGLSLIEASAALLPTEPIDTHRRVADAYRDAFRAIRLSQNSMEPLFAGIRPALDQIEQAGWLLGIATGKSQRGVDEVLEHHGLTGRFATIQTADTNPSKPHPAMLVNAAAEVGVMAADLVMIGDTSFDMLMARSAKAKPIGVAWGYHPTEELLTAGASVVIDTPAALAGLLTGQMDRPACA